ncbi:MAG: response regulator, partial [Candidatus Rokubacteria bacterium]|nr:response regulator [Candidatus Rokubacteria bacterium]
MSWPILSVAIHYEHDVVAARQRARHLAALLGFDTQEQTRIATAVSEIARNAYRYAGAGRVEFSVEGRTVPQVFAIAVSDQGPGIRDLPEILAGQYRSSTGMGLGIVGARRLMDQFHVESAPGRGTTVWLRKIFPRRAALVTGEGVARLAAELMRQSPPSAVAEIQQQNQELLRTLDELRARQEDLQRLNRELEDTNRGVVALYAELDDKADHLRRADEMKTRFLSNMSHEFRTPLNSMLALSQLLLDHVDGALTSEQERQVRYIRTAAEDLSELVNDLLDLAKVEAGKIVVRPAEFRVADLFAALRGMLRPLLVNESVALVFEDVEALPPLVTDEAKVSQILRNFISNALKFTERGEVRVAARADEHGAVVFSVADTGIGIAAEDHERIFEEFSQLENPVQRRVRGTGLGLPLTRRLAALLGGGVGVQSVLGAGSTFTATIPIVYRPPVVHEAVAERAGELDPAGAPVLVVEDQPADALVYEKYFRGTPYRAVCVRTVKAARQAVDALRPRAVILDIVLAGEDTWTFLTELKSAEATRDVPVLVVTTVEDRQKGVALGADAYAVKPIERGWLLSALDRVARERGERTVVVVDDDEISRYLLRMALERAGLRVREVSSGPEGVKLAGELHPAALFLDLVMPGMSGFEVLDQLKAAATTRDIPVVIVTSQRLGDAERAELASRVVSIVAKDSVSA